MLRKTLEARLPVVVVVNAAWTKFLAPWISATLVLGSAAFAAIGSVKAAIAALNNSSFRMFRPSSVM